MIDVRIQAAEFDAGQQLARLREPGGGSVASFVGLLSDDERIAEIVVEHYATMAKDELARIAEEAQERWPLSAIILIHRHGRLRPGEQVAFAAAASLDREAALAACAFLTEALATRAPFWRKHVMTDGTRRWG